MNVLFVGNSYTFYGDVPGQVAAFALADPGAPELRVAQVVRGGGTLKVHVRETGAKARIEEGGWTHVVLQEKSTGPLHDAADYHRYVARLGELARARGAKVLLYETWARKVGHAVYRWRWSGRDPRSMLRRVRAELEKASRALDAEVVPVGTAWEVSLERHLELVLHDMDDHHASALGSHLAASVFYAWLTGRDPTPVSYRAPGVDPDDALALRAVAWDVARERR